MDDPEIICSVCGRATDHRGEHDDLVGLGLARYTENGVSWTRLGWHIRTVHPELVTQLHDISYKVSDIATKEGLPHWEG